jgi:hypothetical protein
MNVIAAAKAFNQRAINNNWHMACDPTLAFTDSWYTDMLDIWRQKAGDRKMPARSQMTPRDLKPYLRNIFLVQREEDGMPRYRWRLIGTSVTEIVGHLTGKLFDDTIPPEHLQRWNGVCDMILESEQPWRFLGRVHIKGREYLKAEHLYMPLSNDNDIPSFVLALCRYTPRHQDNAKMSDEEVFSLPGALL